MLPSGKGGIPRQVTLTLRLPSLSIMQPPELVELQLHLRTPALGKSYGCLIYKWENEQLLINETYS